jgi:hypothetical protein
MMRNACKILVGKPEGKRPFGKHRGRWEDNIRTNLRKIEQGVDWMHLAKDRDQKQTLMNTVISSELSGSIKGREFLN